jgi:CRISPR system Cascade subunit CasA
VTIIDRIGDIAQARAKEAGEAADKLRYALCALLQGAPSEPGPNKRLTVRLNDNASIARAKEWTSLFDQRVQSVFFEAEFWSEAVGDEADHRRRWRERLRALATEVFSEAAEAAPRTEMRRIRAIARAKSLLEGQMRNWLEQLA